MFFLFRFTLRCFLSRSRFLFLTRGRLSRSLFLWRYPGRSLSLFLARFHLSRSWSLRGHASRSLFLFLTRGHLSRSLFLWRHAGRSLSLFLERFHLSRAGYPSLWLGWSSGATLESFLPPSTLATIVLFIKILVITLTLSMSLPIGIRLLKLLIVLRISLIPRKPPRSIPVTGSVDIIGSISVIWGPSVSGAVIVIQDAIQKPITVEIDPRRISPDPGLRVGIRGRGCIHIALSIRRC
jgi:hypothetical protein